MDPVISLAPERAASAMPDEAPLPMPRQSLRYAPRACAKADSAPRAVALRRFFVFAAAGALSALAGWQMYDVLRVGGLSVLEGMVLALFVILCAWISLSFVSALAGFCVLLSGTQHTLGIDPAAPLPLLSRRTALLLPTYNEDPHCVMARLHAIYDSIRKTDRLSHFDFFILSDSTDPAIWIEEEAAFIQLRDELQTERIFYRHRVKNVERKAGNIADWVTRFGGAYECMLVLDADSLMQGETIVRLAAAMERHPNVGLIQTLPQLVNARTVFARLQQFATRVYGPVIATGIAWWHGAEGNYWGHNAIIRVAAFASSAGLPVLNGRKVFGGHILSHDFVEAALMRRAGWAIHMVPQLGGSYEECPPTLTDYAVRDRRWCQGNLQHVGVLRARGLHWISRVHLLTGIGSYLTAPIWLKFLLVGFLISLQAELIRPEYFLQGATLFPHWPKQDPVRAAYVFGATMALLLLPKLFGWVAALASADTRRGIGGPIAGLGSLLFEIIVSALIAPIMMLKQCRYVCEILLGRDAGWSAQRRDESEGFLWETVRHYRVSTVVGIAFAAVAWTVTPSLLVWMLPVIAGLVLAIPIVVLTGSRRWGDRLRALGILLIPEERNPPAILVRANALAASASELTGSDSLRRLLSDPVFFNSHLEMLGPPPMRAKGDIDVPLVLGLAKVDEADSIDEALEMLHSRELFALLADRTGLKHLWEVGGNRWDRSSLIALIERT
jgi:membrane glycosyltransferase